MLGVERERGFCTWIIIWLFAGCLLSIEGKQWQVVLLFTDEYWDVASLCIEGNMPQNVSLAVEQKWKQEFLQLYSWIMCVCRFELGDKVT